MGSSKDTALIIGASSGIGAAYADRLAARGFDLFLVARRRDRLDRAGEMLRKAHGVGVETLFADLSRDDVEFVVNNAGLGALVKAVTQHGAPAARYGPLEPVAGRGISNPPR